jgi:hypothetical protein
VVLTVSIEVKTMTSNMEPGALSARKNASMWEVASPEEVPLYSLVSVRGPEGEILDGYRGVQRQDLRCNQVPLGIERAFGASQTTFPSTIWA